MEKGVRAKLSDSEYLSFRDMSTGADATRVRTNSVFSTGINLETYEIINGFSPEEDSISIAGPGEGYKTAVIANRRSFVANVRTRFKINANDFVKEHPADRDWETIYNFICF